MFRNECPRPEFARKNRLLLNGSWQFEAADSKRENPEHYLYSRLKGEIEVPFAPGTVLSGVAAGGNLRSVWYKKTFTLTKAEAEGNTFLNFAAADYRAEVYVNGNLAAIHKGGYTPFSIDVTAFVRAGKNTLAVNVLDDEADPAIPSGYQGKKIKGGSPSVTGIWGSVWLEFAGQVFIKDAYAYCLPEKKEIIIKGNLSAPPGGGYLSVEISMEGKTLSRHRYKAAEELYLCAPVDAPITPWNPLDGKLYDIEIILTDTEGNITDSVRLYTFYRTVTLAGNRLAINGKPLIIRAVDDYGYYKGGGATAPSADIIKQDFLKLISLGFNAVRPRQRIADPVYLYYADMLGLIVLEDYPSCGMDFDLMSAAENIQADWLELIKLGFRHPSVIFRQPVYSGSESGEAEIAMYNLLKSLDPSRFIMAGGLVFKADIAEIDIGGLTADEAKAKVFERKNGDPKTKRGERVIRKRLPSLMGDGQYKNLPFLVSGLGTEFGAGGKNGEKEVFRRFEELALTALSAGAVGYIYGALSDTESLKEGFIDIDRDDKLTRGGELEVQRINSIE